MHVRVRGWSSRLLLASLGGLIVGLNGLPGGTDSASAIAPPTAANVQVISGTQELDHIACGAPGNCIAVGTTPQGVGVVVPVEGGGGAVTVPGTVRLVGVDCPGPTQCVAVGTGPGNVGTVVPITNGTPGAVIQVPGVNILDSVACTDTSSCVAVGEEPGQTSAVVPINAGAAGTPVPFTSGPGFFLSTVHCPSATVCQAAAFSSDGPTVVATVTGGIVSSSLQVLGGPPFVCPNADSCELLGTDGATGNPAVYSITDGIAQAPADFPRGAFETDLVTATCVSSDVCLFGGQSESTPDYVLMAVVDGQPGALEPLAPNQSFGPDDLTCSANAGCLAVGVSFNGSVNQGALIHFDFPGGTPPSAPVVFPDEPVGLSSAPTPVQLSNLSTTPMNVNALTIEGTPQTGDGDFEIVGTDCNAPVAPFASCTVQVAFTPSVAGPRTAILVFSDDSASSPQQATLKGTGVPPPTSCGCATVGPAVKPQVISVTSTTKSARGTYTLSASRDAQTGITSFDVTNASSGATVLQTSTPANAVFPYGNNLGWGFSPDESRFALHYVLQDPTTGVPTDTVELFDLTQGGHLVYTTSMVGANSALGFSPDGSSFLAAEDVPTTQELRLAVVSSTTGASEFSEDVTATSPPSEPSNASGGGSGTTTGNSSQTAVSHAQSAGTWGFGPDSKSFVLGYVDGNGATQLDVANLVTGGKLSEALPAQAAFWRFSPCGDVLFLVQQAAIGSGQVDVSLIGLGSPATPGPSTTVAASGPGAVQVRTTTANQVATVSGTDHVLAPNGASRGCNAPSAAVGVSGTGTDPLLTLPDDRGTANVPDDLFGLPGTVTVTEADDSPGAWSGLVLAGPILTLSATDSTGSPVTTFSDPATAHVAYFDSDLAAAGVDDPTGLKLYGWTGSGWTPLPVCGGCGVDTSAHTVSATVTGSETFGLFAPAPVRPAPSLNGADVSGTAGTPLDATVAAFAPTTSVESGDDYQAVIDWGDGTSGAGEIDDAGGALTVSGSHTYASEGTYALTETVVDLETGASGSARSQATVAPASTPPAPTSTSTALTASVNPVSAGQPVTFTATVTPAPDGGTVQFATHGTPLGGPVPVGAGGSASSAPTSTLSAGAHHITAVYSGDNSFAESTSPTLSETVNPVISPPPTKVATHLVGEALLASGLAPTARLTRSDNAQPIPAEPVVFTNGKVVLCTAVTNASGTATCRVTGINLMAILLTGFTATFAGSQGYLPSSGKGTLLVGH